MSRKLSSQPESLDVLIPIYAANKAELDSYDKLCKKDNATIKKLMLEAGEDVHIAGGFKATRTVQHRESFNDDALLEVCKKHNITEVVKVKEYVDMDALEDYLYNNEMTEELATDLSDCKTTKEVVTLKVTEVKETNDGE